MYKSFAVLLFFKMVPDPTIDGDSKKAFVRHMLRIQRFTNRILLVGSIAVRRFELPRVVRQKIVGGYVQLPCMLGAI